MADTAAKPIADAELQGLFAILDTHAIDAVMLAVSGGTDSLALLHLFARHRARHSNPPPALVVTVDHGWRAEASAEAAFVAAQAEKLGLPHETIPWTGPKPSTGRQQAAREARYSLMQARLAQFPSSCPAVLTAHTADDQAETLLMRLARSSGVDGLAGMPPVRALSHGSHILLIRPLLDIPRARLAATLAETGLTPVNDPSNADLAYERIRIRAALASLAPSGLTASTLARSAKRLRRAKEALEQVTAQLESQIGSIGPGVSTALDKAAYVAAPEELRIRLLVRALQRHGGPHPRAELAQIEGLASAIADTSANAPRGATLGGCTVQWPSSHITVFRELGRDGLPEVEITPGTTVTWDDRFEISLTKSAPRPLTIRSLPAALWTSLKSIYAGLPMEVALTLPSIWQSETPVAVPDPHVLTPNGNPRHTPCISPPQVEASGQSVLPPFDAAQCSMLPLNKDRS